MRIDFVPKRTQSFDRLIAEAELVFDEPGPLAGMKLVGISIWAAADGGHNVTLPAHSFGVGGERRFFDFLRPTEAGTTCVRDLKTLILEEWKRQSADIPKGAA